MAGLGNLVVTVGADLRKFNSSMKTVKRNINGMTSEFQAAGRSMTVAFTAPIAYLAGTGFQTFRKFEQQMAKVRAVSGATDTEFASLTQSAKDLGSTTRFTASEVSGLQLELSKLGFNPTQIEASTGAILALAQATGEELGPTAETVAKTLNQFGLDASQSGEVADLMATAFSSSALDLTKFSESMGNVAPVAAEFGFNLKDTTKLLGVLANNGIEGADAGTKLKMAFSNIAAEGGDVKNVFNALIGSNANYTEAMEVVKKRAAILIPILSKSKDQTKLLGEALDNSGGAAQRMADIMDDTAEGSMKKMQSAIEGAQIEIGSALAPAITKVAGNVADLAGWFTQLSGSGQNLVLAFGGILATTGPLLVALPKMIQGIQLLKLSFAKMTAVMLANPILAVTAAVVALGFALKDYVQFQDAATVAQGVYEDAVTSANTITAKQMADVDRLSAVVLNEAKSEDERAAALKRLNGIAPEYFGNLDMEAVKTGQLTTAVDQYRESLLNAAKTKVFTRQLEEQVAKMEELKAEFAEGPSLMDDFVGSFMGGGASTIAMTKRITAEMGNTQATIDLLTGKLNDLENTPIEKPATAIEELRSQLVGASMSLRQLTEGTEAYDATKNQIDELKQKIDELTNVKPQAPVEPFNTITTAAGKAKDEMMAAGIEMSNLEEQMQHLSGSEHPSALKEPDGPLTFEDIESGANDEYEMSFETDDAMLTEIEGTLDGLAEKLEQNRALAESFGNSIGAAFGSMISGSMDAGEALKSMAKSLIRPLLGIAKANVIAAMSGPSPDAVATGGLTIPAKIAAGFALVEGLLGAIAFADGGIVSGPTMGLVGEYRGARSNPEVIAPLDKLKGMIQETTGGSNGNGGTLRAVVKGSDLAFVLEKGQKDLQRKRG